MMTHALLAAALDGRVVVLDTTNARVTLMDARTEKVWRSCEGLTEMQIAVHLGDTTSSVGSALQELAAVGLVTCDHDRWMKADVVWV